MAMTLEQARQAIIARMQGFSGIDQMRPNAPSFKAPENGLWCRLMIAGGSSFISGIADKPCTRRTGNIMIQCFDRLHTGEKAITELSDALLNHFEYFNIDHLECLQGQSINAGKDSDFIQYNISIRYKIN
ncbi:hypothetical protein [Acinetobacter sp. YK3]|uniref:hypothetical protein n=1 Tax=Acinetobacter sp. YK3 TaxID=1860097 RepID=UPI00084C6817|nr:hypothetical protein [Acinetobacter sp. YK3]OEC84793.1 hypothetical protein A9Z07_13360 [Acinetobacter sp. YK3]